MPVLIMSSGKTNKFIISIVLPSVLAVVLFILSFYLVLIPLFKSNMMDRKKEMISELTHTAVSLVSDYYHDYSSGIMQEEEAMALAAERIGKMRYGEDRKDYFWISNMRPYMVMHPYRSELNGTDLSDYTDPDGKKLFVEAARVVSEEGEGFIDYKWQWKDDTTLIVPKLSYVKGFSEWQWIIGTGIYLEDVQQEIKLIERKLLWISFIIILLIALVMAYINRQSMLIERGRREAEQKLLLSRQKYKTLVEASSDGTLMMTDGNVIYVNQKFIDLTGYGRAEIMEKRFGEIFDLSWTDIIHAFTDPGRSVNFETTIQCREGKELQVVVSASRVKHNNDYSYILIVKELSRSDILNKEKSKFSHDIQTTLLLMNQQLGSLKSDYISCGTGTAIGEAARLMARKKKEVIFVKQDDEIIGVLGLSDFIKRQMAEGLDPGKPVTSIMSAPVLSVNEKDLIHEAIIKCQTARVSHLLVKNKSGQATGLVSYKRLLEAQMNYTGMLTAEIRSSESVEDMITVYQRMNVLIDAFIESGVKTESITRVISNVADAITGRIIELSIEKEGEPPCSFCFIAMGSQGRGEQTLVTDQDNGIIIDDSGAGDEGAIQYFVSLGRKINDDLNRVGYNYCHGNFMAGNPEWCLPLRSWKELFAGWVNNSDPQGLLDVSIFFDFKSVYGEDSLAGELREHIYRTTGDKAVFYYHLAQTVTRFKPPVGVFGQIVGEHDTPDSNLVDIKKLLMPVTGFARIYALKMALEETNTIERFESMRGAKGLSDSFLDEILQAYNTLMNTRLSQQVKQLMSGEEPGNTVDVNRLTDIERSTLKKVLSVINDIILKLKSDFKGVI
ncbi:MAG: cache domain-containing protein [Bacteroidales bacterium]|nr:cache domain-containing protein [Bacteroidales bacterium]